VFSHPSRKQLILSNITPGVWAMRGIAPDTRGYLTTAASHHVIYVGADPGESGIVGQVVDATSKRVAGAAVTINCGVFNQTTDAKGNCNFMSIPESPRDVRATMGNKVATTTTTLAATTTSTANLMLPP
jgi:hypothetical protein